MKLVNIYSRLIKLKKAPISLYHPRCCFHGGTLNCNASKLNEDAPVQYSGSKAASYLSEETFSPPKRNFPWYQPISVIFSIAVFLIYFAYLREENDIDEGLGRSLYSRISGLEEVQIIQRIEFDKKRGVSTAALERRLKELQGESESK